MTPPGEEAAEPAPVESTFATMLDRAIARRGLSLGRLRYHLRRRGHDVSVATLSYWRRGLARPTRMRSLAAVSALEEVLELPRESLMATLEERLDVSRVLTPDVDELATGLGLEWGRAFSARCLHEVFVMDEGGRPVSHRVRESFVAQQDEVVSYPTAFWADDPASELRVEAVGGCEIGRQADRPGAVVGEVVLPRTLAQGEPWMTEVDLVTERQTVPLLTWSRTVSTMVKVLHFSVLFPPDRVPLQARVTTEVRGVRSESVLVLRGSSLDVHLEDFGPGDACIEWQW